MSERTSRLKENTVIKSHRIVARGLVKETGESGNPYREGMHVKLCLERARLITEAYKQNEHEPMVIKRAKALNHILENMTIFIRPDELIVGNFASTPNSVAHYPELQWRWLEKAICTPDGPYKDLLADEEKVEMKKLHEYWKTRAVHGKERELLPDKMKHLFYYKGLYYWAYHWEMSTPNFEKIFKIGFSGITGEIDDKLSKLDDKYADMTLSSKDYIEQTTDLNAMKIAVNGVTKWLKRYAALASEMAAAEVNEKRKKELEKIADTCDWISEKPARTLFDALQCFWFIHLITNYIDEPQVGNGIRFDKLFNPLYQQDLQAGRITREEAHELLECLWLHFLGCGFLHPPIWSGSGGGGLGWNTTTIGGVDENGEDITNDMTYLVLDTVKTIHTLEPPLALRVHDKTPRELLIKTTEVLHTGVAQPALFNDKFIIPRLMSFGVPLEEARDYAISNCMWPVVPGKNIVHRSSNTGGIFVPKCLELALNQGKDMRTGEQLGPATKDPLQFNSIEDVVEATVEHFKYAAKALFYIGNIANKLYEDYLPRPFLSATLDGCIERGQELRKWCYMPYNDTMGPVGVIITGDALAALKKVVFDKKKVTMAQMIDALKKNWEGYQDLQEMCLGSPKFGNDDDYADFITRDFFYRLAEEVGKIKSYIGGLWVPAIIDGSVASSPYAYSIDTAATPDGRNAGEAFNDGSISPVMGRDRKGPTAVLLSVSKIDPLKTCNHLINQTFTPQYLKDEYVERFVDYLRTWADLGIHHLQFSVVSRETLHDAQVRPQEHPDIIVRVCGYAAFFIDLSKGLQDAVISRTPQAL